MTGTCSQEDVNKVIRCAAQANDVRECCQAKGVFNNGRDFCQHFCNPEAGTPTGDPRYFACLPHLRTIQYCMWASLN